VARKAERARQSGAVRGHSKKIYHDGKALTPLHDNRRCFTICFQRAPQARLPKMPNITVAETVRMSDPSPQHVFLKDLHQPFFLKELPSMVADGPPIDMRHLTHATSGERRLEYQVLELFDRQVEMLLGFMQDSGRSEIAGIAHKLAQSAQEIGARRVAEAALALERAVIENRDFLSTYQTLDCAVVEARLAICALLRTWLLPRRPPPTLPAIGRR
jgi:hypothetical protein